MTPDSTDPSIRTHPPLPAGSAARGSPDAGRPETGEPLQPLFRPEAEMYRTAIERAMARATGARRTDGNAVRVQFDGPSTFQTWLEAIDRARTFVHFENYILRDDATGRRFRDALIAKAEQGVRVRVLYDWMGCWATPRRYWRPFRRAGVEVRAFNRPAIGDPFGVFQRDHRKLVCVDGSVAYVGGFCVGEEWEGRSDAAPWRDTGVEIRGPAAAIASRTFERVWLLAGGAPIDEVEAPAVGEVGQTPVWIIEGVPWRSRVYRAVQLVAANARERIWITDPYFVTPRPVSEALCSAARDGVDVRVLVPGQNNWPWVGTLSRGGYRSLLEAGVRIFEWQGPMIHAKTSVADGLWCRIGSSNLNAASLLGNWEIDAGIVDTEIAAQMEGLFLADMASSIEIVLPGGGGQGPPARTDPSGQSARARAPLEPEGGLQDRIERWRQTSPYSRNAVRVADLVRAGSSFGDALAGRRPLAREDRAVVGTAAAALVLFAGLASYAPRAVGWVVAAVLWWLGMTLAVRGLIHVRRARRSVAPARTDAASSGSVVTSGDTEPSAGAAASRGDEAG